MHVGHGCLVVGVTAQGDANVDPISTSSPVRKLIAAWSFLSLAFLAFLSHVRQIFAGSTAKSRKIKRTSTEPQRQAHPPSLQVQRPAAPLKSALLTISLKGNGTIPSAY